LTIKKKKFNYKLIPVSSFHSQIFNSNQSKVKIKNESKPIADINISDYETSTLSLKSIEKDKDLADETIELENEFNEEKIITIEDVLELWGEYSNIQEEKGRYNIASILRISIPKYENNNIIYTVPNNTTSLEVEREKPQIILFLTKKLKTKVNILTEIDMKADKKIAYTNKEKYELLKKKNPLIENLKKEFRLSI